MSTTSPCGVVGATRSWLIDAAIHRRAQTLTAWLREQPERGGGEDRDRPRQVLEADLLGGAGERVVRVPTKLMTGARDAARTHGKSDPSTPWR